MKHSLGVILTKTTRLQYKGVLIEMESGLSNSIKSLETQLVFISVTVSEYNPGPRLFKFELVELVDHR